MKRIFTIFSIFAIILSIQSANATMYECTYKNSSGRTLVSSYNSLVYTQPNRKELIYALKSGNCKELIVKRYFIDGTICNIQFYKYSKSEFPLCRKVSGVYKHLSPSQRSEIFYSRSRRLSAECGEEFITSS